MNVRDTVDALLQAAGVSESARTLVADLATNPNCQLEVTVGEEACTISDIEIDEDAGTVAILFE